MASLRWLLISLAIIAAPLIAWLIFATVVWLNDEWETASYAIGWTFNMAVLASGYLVAIATPIAVIAAVTNAIQERRARKRGWR